MIRGSADEAQRLFLALPEGIPLRDIREEWDYGSEETRLVHLRRTWVAFLRCNPQTSYGIYLGRHDGKYVVGVRDIMEEDVVFTSCEYFDTLEECKDEWMVDIVDATTMIKPS